MLWLSRSSFHCSVSARSAVGHPWYFLYLNIELWRIFSKGTVNCWWIRCSKILDISGRTVTGWKFSFSNCDSFSWCGTISPHFQESGTTLKVMIVLIRWLRGRVIDGMDALSARGGMWSWPVALFAFILCITVLTNSWLIKLNSNCSPWFQFLGIFDKCGWFSKEVCCWMSRLSVTFLKWLFRISATWFWSLTG